MEFHLHQKNILVTGGSQGLGFASAKACLQRGAKVVLCARTQADVDQAVRSLREEGFAHVLGQIADVTKQEEIERMLDRLESSFGALHGVIHAAGVYGTIGNLTQVQPEEWLEGIKINLFGSFLVARQSCLRLQRSGKGRIVLFSGGGATSPFPNYTAYASSKAAVVRFAESIAQEMAPFNIEINCVAPGFVITRLHKQTLQAKERAGAAFVETTEKQLSQGGIPAEIGADAAAFLVSDAAQGITGKLISAPYDNWKKFPERLQELKESDLFTLRRIVPKDRGLSWQ